MNFARVTLALTTLAITTATFAVNAPSAHAQSTPAQYKLAMRGLIRDTDSWMVELDVQLGAMTVKPELGCSAEYAEFVRRGGWLADDLRGSALSAPAVLAGANAHAGAGFDAILGAATVVIEDCSGSSLGAVKAQADEGKSEYLKGLRRIRTFVRTGL